MFKDFQVNTIVNYYTTTKNEIDDSKNKYRRCI